jgi:hypothetical protein
MKALVIFESVIIVIFLGLAIEFVISKQPDNYALKQKEDRQTVEELCQRNDSYMDKNGKEITTSYLSLSKFGYDTNGKLQIECR